MATKGKHVNRKRNKTGIRKKDGKKRKRSKRGRWNMKE
jgi:hypothetical protein